MESENPPITEIKSDDSEITLKPLTLEDCKEYLNLVDRNKEFLIPADRYQTLEEMKSSFDDPIERKKLRFTIRNNEDAIVGAINLNTPVNESTTTEVSYWLGEEFTKKGYAGKSLKTLTQYATEELGYKALFAKVKPANRRSVNVLLNCGFKYSGDLESQWSFTFLKK